MRETIGIMMSLTSEVTMAVKAEPTTIPTARSMTLPRLIKSINSLRKPLFLARSSLRLAAAFVLVSFDPIKKSFSLIIHLFLDMKIIYQTYRMMSRDLISCRR